MVVSVVYLDEHSRMKEGNAPLPSWLTWTPAEVIQEAPGALRYPDFARDLHTAQADRRPVDRYVPGPGGLVHVVLSPLPPPWGGACVTFLEGSVPAMEAQRLSSYIDAIPENLVILDREGTIRHVNKGWVEFGSANGAPVDLDWRGVNYLEVCQAVKGPERDDADEVTHGLKEVLTGRRDFFQWEYPCHSPTEQRWFLMEATPIRESAWGGVAVSHLNITARVLAETKARLADAILDTSAEAIMVTTPDETIIRVNPAFTTVTGYAAEEVLGQTPRLLASGHHDAAFYQAMWQSLRETGSWRGEVWNQRKSGEVYPELVTINAVRDAAGQTTHYVCLFSDITTLKTNEARLRAINIELEQFAYAVSHDLRQPLRMITSYLQLLLRRMGADLSPDALDFIGEAVRGAQRMDQLIADLLDYACVGRDSGDSTAVPLAAVLERVLHTLAPAIEEAKARIEISPALPVVRGTESDLERVFENLIGNALKYRDPERPLEVRIEASGDAGQASIQVRDNGIGLEAGEEEAVFGMFRRLRSGMARAGGAGIGLAICKKLIEHHGGSIRAEAAAGGPGCAFQVTLPLVPKARERRRRVGARKVL